MKAINFFKILNKKIEKYDKLASNPFIEKRPFIIIWVEEAELKNSYKE